MNAIAPILSGALVLGFVGSVHCLGMCGGIAGALGQALPPQSQIRKLFRTSVYSLGRITSYATAGAIGHLAVAEVAASAG